MSLKQKKKAEKKNATHLYIFLWDSNSLHFPQITLNQIHQRTSFSSIGQFKNIWKPNSKTTSWARCFCFVWFRSFSRNRKNLWTIKFISCFSFWNSHTGREIDNVKSTESEIVFLRFLRVGFWCGDGFWKFWNL